MELTFIIVACIFVYLISRRFRDIEQRVARLETSVQTPQEGSSELPARMQEKMSIS